MVPRKVTGGFECMLKTRPPKRDKLFYISGNLKLHTTKQHNIMKFAVEHAEGSDL